MPSTKALIFAGIGFILFGAVSIFVSYKLAGTTGAVFMTFGVIVASLLSIMGVGFNVYYSKKHARTPAPRR